MNWSGRTALTNTGDSGSNSVIEILPGGLIVKETLVNSGPTQARVTRVSFELLDAAGQTITRSSVSNPRLAPLAPGAQIPWQGLIDPEPGAGQLLRVSVTGVVVN